MQEKRKSERTERKEEVKDGGKKDTKQKSLLFMSHCYDVSLREERHQAKKSVVYESLL